MFYLVCTRRPCLCAHCLCCADRAPSRHLARAAIHGLRVPPETHLALEGVCLRRPRAPHRPLRRKEIGTCYGDFGHITCIKDPEIVSVGKAYLFLLSSLSLLSIHHLFTIYSPPCFLHRHLCYWCCATCSSKGLRTASQILPLLADAVFTLKYKALVFLPYVDEVLDAQVESVESDRVKVRAWPQEIKISKKVCRLLVSSPSSSRSLRSEAASHTARSLPAHALTRAGTLRPQTLEDAKFVYDEENEKWTRDAETIERGSRVRVKVTSVNQQAQSIVSVPPLPPPPLTASPTAVRAGDRPEVRLSVCRVCCRRRRYLYVQIPPSYHFVRHRFAERLRCRRAKQTFF